MSETNDARTSRISRQDLTAKLDAKHATIQFNESETRRQSAVKLASRSSRMARSVVYDQSSKTRVDASRHTMAHSQRTWGLRAISTTIACLSAFALLQPALSSVGEASRLVLGAAYGTDYAQITHEAPLGCHRIQQVQTGRLWARAESTPHAMYVHLLLEHSSLRYGVNIA